MSSSLRLSFHKRPQDNNHKSKTKTVVGIQSADNRVGGGGDEMFIMRVVCVCVCVYMTLRATSVKQKERQESQGGFLSTRKNLFENCTVCLVPPSSVARRQRRRQERKARLFKMGNERNKRTTLLSNNNNNKCVSQMSFKKTALSQTRKEGSL